MSLLYTRVFVKVFFQISIDLIDENDHSPEFPRPRYSAEVVENWPIGATVVKVSATDKDSEENSRISYRLDVVTEQGRIRSLRSSLLWQNQSNRSYYKRALRCVLDSIKPPV